VGEVARIAQAVLSGGLSGPEAGPAFEIYRNNYRQGLARALTQSFPTVEQLVGPDFFAAMALAYVEATPPTSRYLRDYGGTFSDFVRAFAPAAAVPYLADVAELEYGLVQAFYAADDADDPPSDLATIGLESRLKWRTSTRVVRSAYPIVSIWRAHKSGETLEGVDWRSETGLITRQAHTVGASALDMAEAIVADVFRQASPLISALEALGPDSAPAAAHAFRRLLDLQALSISK